MRVQCCGTVYVLLYDTEIASILSRKNHGDSHYSTVSCITRNMKLSAGAFIVGFVVFGFFGMVGGWWYVLTKFNKDSAKKGIQNEILK